MKFLGTLIIPLLCCGLIVAQQTGQETAVQVVEEEASPKAVPDIEGEVGTLEPGKYADFVVLSENPLEVDPMKIKDINVEATVMNGRITYLAQTKGFYHH